MWQRIKKIDWLLAGSVLVLTALGLLELCSIDAGNQTSNFFIKQVFFVLGGIGVMFLFASIDARIYRNRSLLLVFLYLFSLILLILVLFLGHMIRGMMGWFEVGLLHFAPVELAKISVILLLAKYFSGRHIEVYRVRHIIASAIYVALPTGLVLLQPDLGSAMILVFIWLGIILLSGMKQRHLLIVLMVGLILASLAWFSVLKPYQHQRILTFLNPARDPLGSSYNLIQSKIAIGSGGLWGKSLGHGTQGQYNFLPERQADFIFAVFAEEWGFIGVLFLFALLAIFFGRLIRIILVSTNNFFRLLVAGYAIMIFVQISINIGMSLGLLPIAGISLPFLSYGGSNLLINFAGLGIVQNIFGQIKQGGD